MPFQTIARVISIIGHPLLLGTLYVVFMSYYRLDQQIANWVSFLIIGCVALPILVNNMIQTKRGNYTNFDVSDRKQRRGFYPFALGLFLLVLALFYTLDFPRPIVEQTLVFFILLLVMTGLNFFTKASLHAAIAFYIAINLWDVQVYLGIVFFILGLAICWARVYSGRHTLLEIILGGVLGIFFGLIGIMLFAY